MVKKIAEKGYVFLVLALMYLPILMVIIFSFSGSAHFTFNNGFTFDSYKELFTDAPKKLWDSLLNTVIIAIISSVAATIMGSIAAVGIYNMKPRSRHVVENINQLPIVNSEIVMAVSLMLFFVLHSICGAVGHAPPYADGSEHLRGGSGPRRFADKSAVQGGHSVYFTRSAVGVRDGVHDIVGRLYHHSAE